MLIWTAFVSYAGPFSLSDRGAMIDSWMTDIKLQKIPCTENADIVDAVVNANTVSTAAIFFFFCSLLNSICSDSVYFINFYPRRD